MDENVYICKEYCILYANIQLRPETTEYDTRLLLARLITSDTGLRRNGMQIIMSDTYKAHRNTKTCKNI